MLAALLVKRNSAANVMYVVLAQIIEGWDRNSEVVEQFGWEAEKWFGVFWQPLLDGSAQADVAGEQFAWIHVVGKPRILFLDVAHDLDASLSSPEAS